MLNILCNIKAVYLRHAKYLFFPKRRECSANLIDPRRTHLQILGVHARAQRASMCMPHSVGWDTKHPVWHGATKDNLLSITESKVIGSLGEDVLHLLRIRDNHFGDKWAHMHTHDWSVLKCLFG